MERTSKRTRACAIVTLVALTIGALLMAMNMAACAQQPGSASLATGSSKATATDPSGSADAREASKASRPDAENVLVCIGDSITFGSGVDDPAHEAWPALLQEKLGSDWYVANLGAPGTMLLVESSNPYRSTGYIELAKSLDPAMVIIMLGTNDSGDRSFNANAFRAQLASLVDEIASSSEHDVQFVLMDPPCTFFTKNNGWYRDTNSNDLIGGEMRAIVEQVAADKGARCIDLFAFTEAHPEWFPDELHPDRAGNQAIADHLFDELFG